MDVQPTLSQTWKRPRQFPQYAFKVSMLECPAVHIPTRSLLRSSSTPEPSDPLYSVIFSIRQSSCHLREKSEHISSHPIKGKGSSQTHLQAEILLRNNTPHPQAGHRRAKGSKATKQCWTRCDVPWQTGLGTWATMPRPEELDIHPGFCYRTVESETPVARNQ